MRATYTIVYPDKGEKYVIDGTRKTYQESYDAQIDKPMTQRLLDNWKKFEADGTLRPTDIIHSKTWMRDALRDVQAREEAGL